MWDIHARTQDLCFAFLIKLHTFLWTDFYQHSMNLSIHKLYVSVLGYAKFNFVDVKSQSNGTSIYI